MADGFHPAFAGVTEETSAPLEVMVRSYLFESTIRAGKARQQPRPAAELASDWELGLDACGTGTVGMGDTALMESTSTLPVLTGLARNRVDAGRPSRVGPARKFPELGRRTNPCCACAARPTQAALDAAQAAGHNRYRRIEDLVDFVHTGEITENTRYFLDPMLRRSGNDRSSGIPAQVVVADPRESVDADIADANTRLQDQREAVVPKHVLLAKRQFAHTTGQVRPYALGRGHSAQLGQVKDALAPESAMDAYVLSVQSQRPTKGLYSYV